ncbi:hypothetical protein TRP8649_03597 [Pelagimonas phthalicica]|uniref:DUF983 domain-containing protein n=1 Tax=Pelagimonas phthalicica TaxID=1037362 RepID=A0A238JGD9_9RHOB|nr:DUF983 domain-containing protein [Pelagimonas phthalicica]TDS92402.1 uncharacterized protein (DUF983 family) [Pelagimonas phthalicica]SMX29463.1 hypothetical protein TRP8649_03597 [Pelagimonas phthalicica]
MSDVQNQMIEDETRDVKRAIWRGLRLRCPNCGEGKLLHSYLKVNESCDCCGLELKRAKADDGPAYMTILIVGHILGFGMHFAFVAWRPEPLTMVMIGLALTISSSLIMLPRMKGLIIGFQWAKRMYGL